MWKHKAAVGTAAALDRRLCQHKCLILADLTLSRDVQEAAQLLSVLQWIFALLQQCLSHSKGCVLAHVKKPELSATLTSTGAERAGQAARNSVGSHQVKSCLRAFWLPCQSSAEFSKGWQLLAFTALSVSAPAFKVRAALGDIRAGTLQQ